MVENEKDDLINSSVSFGSVRDEYNMIMMMIFIVADVYYVAIFYCISWLCFIFFYLVVQMISKRFQNDFS